MSPYANLVTLDIDRVRRLAKGMGEILGSMGVQVGLLCNGKQRIVSFVYPLDFPTSSQAFDQGNQHTDPYSAIAAMHYAIRDAGKAGWIVNDAHCDRASALAEEFGVDFWKVKP